MAETYRTDRTSTTSVQAPRANVGLTEAAVAFVVGTTNANLSALAANDVIQLFKVPKGAVIHELSVSSDGTQATNSDSVIQVGDGNDADRFLMSPLGLVLRSGGAVERLNNPAGHCYQYTEDDTIDLKVSTVGTGQTTGGTIKAALLYSMQDDV